MNLRSAIKTLALPALLVVLAAVMVRASGGPPTGDPIPGATPPVVKDGADGPSVRNSGAQQQLRVYDVTIDGAVRVFEANALDALVGDRNIVQRTGEVLAVRSPREFALAPVQPDEPLIERVDASGRITGGFGKVQVPASAFLGQLVNTGWIAPAPDDGVVFAAALRPEVIHFGPDGKRLWRSERPAPRPIAPPLLVRSGSSVTAKFTEVQHGIARGPDGRFYILTGAHADSVRLDVLDADGVFERTTWVPRGHDIFVDGRGRVAAVTPGESLRSETRAAFYPFDVESLDDAARVRLADFAGKVVVVNVWASWCAPCRHEMPALDWLATKLDTSEVAIVALNEDVDIDAARRFVDSLGGVRYVLARGDGKLRGRIGYRGLPYTAVLDRSHRIAKVILGFGNDLDDLEHAIDAVLNEDRRAQP